MRDLRGVLKSAYAVYVIGGAVVALLTAMMVATRKVEGLTALPAAVDSLNSRLSAHTLETRGTNARLDKLLCVETSFTQQAKIACLRAP